MGSRLHDIHNRTMAQWRFSHNIARLSIIVRAVRLQHNLFDLHPFVAKATLDQRCGATDIESERFANYCGASLGVVPSRPSSQA